MMRRIRRPYMGLCIATEAIIGVLVSCLATHLGFTGRHPYLTGLTWGLFCTLIVLKSVKNLIKDVRIRTILITSYSCKIIVAACRLIHNQSIISVRENVDAIHFWNVAIEYYFGIFRSFKTRYPYILNAEFHVFGVNYFCAMMVNVVLATICVIAVYKTLELLCVSKECKCMGTAIAAFMPYANLIASSIMREPIYICCVGISLYMYVASFVRRRCREIVFSICIMMPVIALHSGYFPIVVVYLVTLFLRTIISCGATTARGVVVLLLGCAGIVCSLLLFDSSGLIRALVQPDAVLKYIAGTSELNAATDAGSAYLTGLQIDSWAQVILYAPLQLIFFYGSPLPLDWRGIADVAAFAFDGTVYLICLATPSVWVVYSRLKVKMIEDACRRQTLLIALLGMLILGGIVFGYGTHNAGSAIRHRIPLYTVGIVSLMICLDHWGKTCTIRKHDVMR